MCDMCGMEIVRNRKYCDKCTDIAKGILATATRQETSEKKKNIERMKYYHSDSLIEAIKKADKMGISYGEYMAFKEGAKCRKKKMK